MSSAPDVSILIRTLNEADALPETMRAILDQACGREIEFVVVDSGSTDGTVEVAESFGDRARVVVVRI